MSTPLDVRDFGGKWRFVMRPEDPLVDSILTERERQAYLCEQAVRQLSEGTAFIPDAFKPEGAYEPEYHYAVKP